MLRLKTETDGIGGQLHLRYGLILPDGQVSRLKGDEAELADALIGQGVLVPQQVARHGRIRVPGERAAQRRAKPIAEPGRAIRGVDDEIDVGARLDVPVGVLALINPRLPVREHLGSTHGEATNTQARAQYELTASTASYGEIGLYGHIIPYFLYKNM